MSGSVGNNTARASGVIASAAVSQDVVNLGRIQVTSGATIDVDGLFTADYDYYRLVVQNWVMSSAWKTYLRVMVGGSSNTDSSYNRTIFRSYTDTTPSNSVTAYGDYDSVDFWEAMGGDNGSNSNTTSGAVFGWFDIYKPLNTTQWKHVVYNYGHGSGGTTFQNQFGHLMWKNTAAISGLRLYSDITTVTDFDATLYGYKPG